MVLKRSSTNTCPNHDEGSLQLLALCPIIPPTSFHPRVYVHTSCMLNKPPDIQRWSVSPLLSIRRSRGVAISRNNNCKTKIHSFPLFPFLACLCISCKRQIRILKWKCFWGVLLELYNFAYRVVLIIVLERISTCHKGNANEEGIELNQVV